MKAPIYSLALAVLLATPLPVAAQTVDAEAIVDALRTDLPGRGKRGLTILDDEDVPPPAIDLRIGFDYNEATLTVEARQSIRALAAALSDERLANLRFEIIGHTDARGSDAYNDDLSERRALAVASSLTTDHGLDPSRFVPLGRGERELIKPSDPESGENRRVEVRTILD